MTGRVNVKMRGRDIETYGALLTRGEPVIVTGKVTFPRRDEDAAEDAEEAPREATILFNEAKPLSEAVRAGIRGLHIRLAADKVHPTRSAR